MPRNLMMITIDSWNGGLNSRQVGLNLPAITATMMPDVLTILAALWMGKKPGISYLISEGLKTVF
jgi:hypothetical protein